MTIEVLYFDGCPSHAALLPHLHRLLERGGVRIPVVQTRIEDDEAAQEHCFLGSPSVRVDGEDVEPNAGERRDFGMRCRLYATPDGLRGTPPDAWIVTALART